VCIDDFAIKKGNIYGTVMIDIETRKIIDMIESREREKVTEWIRSYPNIEVVTRDGSSSYKRAIKEANKKIIQISDRFHLIKNLTDYCKEYILKKITPKIKIGETIELKIAKTETSELEKYKTKIIEKVKELKSSGKSIRQISKEIGLNRKTVSKYLKIEGKWRHKSRGTSKKSKIDKHSCKIKRLLEKGFNKTEIYNEIRKDGYKGSYGLVVHYINKDKAKAVKNSEVVLRKDLIKLLYKPLENIKTLTKEMLMKVIDKYDFLVEIYSSVEEFKEVIKSKEVLNLHKWIKKYEKSEIIKSFINGVKNDIEAIENSIKYEYSNGLAEGKINKIKLIKRKMYGRCKFETLKNRVLMNEYCFK
jgi:transposase